MNALRRFFLPVLLLPVLFALFLLPVFAVSEDDPLADENEVYSAAWSLLDPDTARLLESVGVDPEDLSSLFSLSPTSLLTLVKNVFSATSSDIASQFLAAGAALLTAAVLLPLCPESVRDTAGQCAALFAVFLISAPAVAAARSVASAVRLTRTLELSLLPVPVAAASLAGKPLTAAVVENGVFFFAETVGAAFSDAVVPLTAVLMTLCAAAAIDPDDTLSRLTAGLSKGLTLFAGLVSGVFALVTRLQGTLAGAADSVTVKSARILVGSAVPVVGGALADTLSGVLEGVRLAGGSVAMLGVLLALVVLLPALAAVLTVKLFLWAAALFAPAVGMPKAGDYATALSSAFTLLGAAAVFHAAVYVISLALLLH